jgi:hypothetical protein
MESLLGMRAGKWSAAACIALVVWLMWRIVGHVPPQAESEPGTASLDLCVCGALERLDRLHSPHGATVVG